MKTTNMSILSCIIQEISRKAAKSQNINTLTTIAYYIELHL